MGRGSNAATVLYGPSERRRHSSAEAEPPVTGYWVMGDRDQQSLELTEELIEYLKQHEQGDQAERIEEHLVKSSRRVMPFKVTGYENCLNAAVDGSRKLLLDKDSALILRQPLLKGLSIEVPPQFSMLEPVSPGVIINPSHRTTSHRRNGS